MSTGESIINIGSISGGVADRSMALYKVSKTFVHGLSRSIAVDHGPDLRCKVISPGWIETGMLEADFNLATEPARASQATIDRHASLWSPQDIETMATFLVSEEASFFNGQIFTMCGELTATLPINPTLT